MSHKRKQDCNDTLEKKGWTNAKMERFFSFCGSRSSLVLKSCIWLPLKAKLDSMDSPETKTCSQNGDWSTHFQGKAISNTIYLQDEIADAGDGSSRMWVPIGFRGTCKIYNLIICAYVCQRRTCAELNRL